MAEHVDKCRGCSLVIRPLDLVLRDIAAAPSSASVTVVAPAADVRACEKRLRELLLAKLGRFQLELAGYCYACSFRGELNGSAEDAEPRRAAHG